ncbi:unnamed protein product [Pleuronectes platessa]|uniref:Uncharacterized protein n=1 Tax=Pleuronectes platessa TaxID=8262 RepID=A0A9N7TGN5_PLEPL|nr:unnamed protein product [Pleuronectes platessa]
MEAEAPAFASTRRGVRCHGARTVLTLQDVNTLGGEGARGQLYAALHVLLLETATDSQAVLRPQVKDWLWGDEWVAHSSTCTYNSALTLYSVAIVRTRPHESEGRPIATTTAAGINSSPLLIMTEWI